MEHIFVHSFFLSLPYNCYIENRDLLDFYVLEMEDPWSLHVVNGQKLRNSLQVSRTS